MPSRIKRTNVGLKCVTVLANQLFVRPDNSVAAETRALMPHFW
jgi:hypothetical protein